MSNWHTLLVKCFTVYCSGRSNEEFKDFDDACTRAAELEGLFPRAVVEVSALLDTAA